MDEGGVEEGGGGLAQEGVVVLPQLGRGGERRGRGQLHRGQGKKRRGRDRLRGGGAGTGASAQ